MLTDDAGAVGVVFVFVGVEKGGSDALDSFFLACSASLARNSFCFASKEDTPSGVMSANAGARKKGVVVLKARIEGRELELLIMRRANMMGTGEAGSVACTGNIEADCNAKLGSTRNQVRFV